MGHENLETKQKKHLLGWKILAWLDLTIGLIPILPMFWFVTSLIMGSFDGFSALAAMVMIAFIGPLLITNAVLGIGSFRSLRRMSADGIHASVILKVIFVLATTIYGIMTIVVNGGVTVRFHLVLLPPIILVFIVAIVAIRFVFLFKDELVKFDGNSLKSGELPIEPPEPEDWIHNFKNKIFGFPIALKIAGGLSLIPLAFFILFLPFCIEWIMKTYEMKNLNKLCKAGNNIKCHELSQMEFYRGGNEEANGNIAEASKWYNKSCNNGHAESCYKLAVIEDEKVGSTESYELYKKACSPQRAALCFSLAKTEEEKGNNEEAVRLLNNACNGRYGEACFRLGMMMANEGNSYEKESYFRRACNSGFAAGCPLIDKSRSNMLSPRENSKAPIDLKRKLLNSNY